MLMNGTYQAGPSRHTLGKKDSTHRHVFSMVHCHTGSAQEGQEEGRPAGIMGQ